MNDIPYLLPPPPPPSLGATFLPAQAAANPQLLWGSRSLLGRPNTPGRHFRPRSQPNCGCPKVWLGSVGRESWRQRRKHFYTMAESQRDPNRRMAHFNEHGISSRAWFPAPSGEVPAFIHSAARAAGRVPGTTGVYRGESTRARAVCVAISCQIPVATTAPRPNIFLALVGFLAFSISSHAHGPATRTTGRRLSRHWVESLFRSV